MIGAIVSALLGSFWLRIALAATVGLGALKGYGLYERHKGTQAGRAEVTAVVEKKADDNAKLAEEIREAVNAAPPPAPPRPGKPRMRSKYERAGE